MDKGLLIGLLSPILLTLGGIITLLIKARRESILAIEEAAKEKRFEVYKNVLEPFIVLLHPKATTKEKEKATYTVTTTEYRKHTHDLVFWGSDEMVKAYNSLMQNFFHNDLSDDKNLFAFKTTLKLYSAFLLEIRKDLYNNNTKLKRSEMIEFWFSDIKEYKDAIND